MLRRDDLTFSMAEYEQRLAVLRQDMEERRVDAMIVTTPQNMTYLTGYQTPGYWYFQTLVVPLAGEPFMVTRLLEASNIEARTWVEHSRPYQDTDNAIASTAMALSEFGLKAKRLGYEKHCYFFRATEQEALFEACPDATFVDCSGLVEERRVVKSEEELALMRRVAKVTEAGMRAGIAAVAVGASENDVAAEIDGGMFRAGGEYPAIAPFVASGPRGAIGHATWEGRRIGAGECVFIEIGGCIQRYHTAMMRPVFTGELDDDMREAERIVVAAVEASMAAMKPGVPAGEVDAVNRAILADNRFGAVQATRSAYSIGIAFAPDWGEGHILSILPGEERPLEENMTFHLIPWIQVHGRAGIGISETVRVTPTSAESFFTFERKIFTQ